MFEMQNERKLHTDYMSNAMCTLKTNSLNIIFSHFELVRWEMKKKSLKRKITVGKITLNASH